MLTCFVNYPSRMDHHLMIKAVINTGGKPLLLLGLSRMNIEKLTEGLPIKIEGSEVGMEVDIALVYGETEDQIRRDLVKKLGPPKVDVDRR